MIESASHRAEQFDYANADALAKLWFLGDVHGTIRHVTAALRKAKVLPQWLVFAGDVDLVERSFSELLEPIRHDLPELQVAFIHGNHDADTKYHWQRLHSDSQAVSLHGRVHRLGGIRVAGLGGTFLQRVWQPPGPVVFRNKQEAILSDPYRWPGETEPHTSLQGAIYPDDVSMLAAESADLLLTHEAFSCHPRGFATLDHLARSLGVFRAFHGHQHDDLSDAYAPNVDALGFDARALGCCGIKDGLGRVIALHQEGW